MVPKGWSSGLPLARETTFLAQLREEGSRSKQEGLVQGGGKGKEPRGSVCPPADAASPVQVGSVTMSILTFS